MENQRYKAFLECVRCGSISAAAEVLGCTPSAVSQLVASLEKDLGIKLLNRSQRGVVLTAEGSAMIPVVRSYLAQEEAIYQYASELKGVTTGKLTIATYSSIAVSWLPEVVRQFKKEYPGVQISIIECIRSDIIRYLDQKEADVAFLAYTEPMPYEWIPLMESTIIAAIPEDHPLAGASAFPVAECENYDFILGSWGKEPEILEIFRKQQVHPVIKYTTYDTPASLAMVRMGLGISFVNELSAKYWNEHLVKLPLDPPENIMFGMAVPPKESLTNAARKFIRCTMNYFGK